MNIIDIIIKKRNGNKLNKEEIEFAINGYTNDVIPDYQISAFLMAIYFKGMDPEETYYLTKAMLNSGDILDLSKIKGVKVDKHSTGGVGDKTSLVVAPLVASLGIKVAKMSGRGLGHTGGTIDKLESIPGYDVNISEEDFINQVNKIGVALVGQTKKLVPADKKLYSLRDVTGTVDSIPLIASSIMSKKLASGADVIVLDVKVGSGAFMKNLDEARKLALAMVQIGKMEGKKVAAILTDMSNPLGKAVGNSLEVIEAINTLNGNGPKDFTDLCIEASAELILEANYAKNIEDAKALAIKQIENKEGLKKFADLVEAQHGDASYIYDPSKFDKSKYVYDVIAKNSGYVNNINSLMIGNASMKLGAGRIKLDDIINPRVGIVLEKKPGDYVNVGDVLAKLYSDDNLDKDIYNMVLDAYKIKESYEATPLVLDIIK
ncbi:MAG: pyrimidine-nucleoside phosphorylase [Acholeplasmatales bacterium]|nr:pyrimidine-nucleoside phosphorylase [Acholeplasmatales bacterium]